MMFLSLMFQRERPATSAPNDLSQSPLEKDCSSVFVLLGSPIRNNELHSL